MTRNLILSFLLCHLLYPIAGPFCRTMAQLAGGGRWDLLLPNIGISAMHMQLLRTDRVIIFDRTDFGPSNISLLNGKCRFDQNDNALTTDCYAHSVEYDVVSNTIRPLMILTDTWCSSGAVMADGSLVQTGGYNDGDRVVRSYLPCDGCDWEEIKFGLIQRRWYATNHILPDGRQIIIGGRRQFNFEFYPKIESAKIAYNLPFLVQTNDPRIENNLYPFVFLNVDGNLFIFANNRAILFDYTRDVVVKQYPKIPGGDPRCYPSTGSAVLLPVKLQPPTAIATEVLICGGAPKGSYNNAQRGVFVAAINTCGRIKITDPTPTWVMETMPMARVMGDMVLLPNGNVLIINGGSSGVAGWGATEGGFARDPVLTPVIYRPDGPIGNRFEIQNPTTIPRMYHSTAVLLRDTRILVGGSNPHSKYKFADVIYPTELRLETFSPAYLNEGYANLRPKIISPVSQAIIGYEKQVPIHFIVTGVLNQSLVTVTMVAPPFSTHSFSMNQRLVVLNVLNLRNVGNSTHELLVLTPGSGKLAPSGSYLLFVVHQEIPSEGIWVKIQ